LGLPAPDFDESDVWSVKRFTSARNALKFYRVMAFITGTMLLILTAEMIYKYLIAADSETALTFGDFNLAAGPSPSATAGATSSTSSAASGSTSRCAGASAATSSLRWPASCPVMSFILERRIHRQVDAELEAAVVVAPKS
jgi:hypothetical protein